MYEKQKITFIALGDNSFGHQFNRTKGSVLSQQLLGL
jgi:hypothetical protein